MYCNIKWFRRAATAGLIGVLAFSSPAQNTQRSITIPFFPSGSYPLMEGFARVINQSAEDGEVRIDAYDDSGRVFGPVSLSVGGRETIHFYSDDLESGGDGSVLSSGVGRGQGDWRLRLTSELDLKVLAYVVAADGFQTAIHDSVPSEGAAHQVAIFNPASDLEQSSELRLVNLGDDTAHVTIAGIDDSGQSPGAGAAISIAPGAARTLTSLELEFGTAMGLTGSLGDGVGKWRLQIESSQPIVAMSLLSSSTGYLTNLSTRPAPWKDGSHVVPLLPSASDSYGRQGIVRVANRSGAAGDVTIRAYDDANRAYTPLTLAIGPDEAVQFTSNGLEFGNANAGLAGSTGLGYGNWWLKLSSELDLDVLSYVRSADGFLTSMHDTAPNDGTQHSIATFGPGSDVNQTSLLRMVNPGEAAATAVIIGVDDQGRSPGTHVRVTVPPRSSKTLSATELESGGGDLEGTLGDGTGSWQLSVESEMPLIVASLRATRTGYLTNLSTLPAQDGELETQNPDLQVSGVAVAGMADGIQPGSALTLSLVVQNVGDVESAATTVRYYQSNNATISTLDTEVGNDAVDALEPSVSSEKSALLTAPSSPGTYYYGACIDAVAGESERVDNCSASVQVIVEDSEQHPDLEVGPPSVGESAPVAGAEFTLSATVRNTGDGAASATTVRYYQSNNATISTLDTEVGNDAIDALEPSVSSEKSALLTAPSSPGTYYYGACIDAVAGESETVDNCSASVRVIVEDSEQHPDLEVGPPSVGESAPVAGAEFTLSATVRNTGDGAASATTVRYYQSNNATISTLDTEVGNDAVDALEPSVSSEKSALLTAPSSPGTYYYGACIDAVAGESERVDNCSASVQVIVEDSEQHPDLEVGPPSVSESAPVAGAEFTLSATVRNTGDGAASATTVRYYQSNNATISTLDTEVGNDAVDALEPSVSSEKSALLTAPSSPGTYYYGACIDAVAGESETVDNCSASVQVIVEDSEQHPDLEVGPPSVSESAPVAGAEFTLSATVRNTGDGAASATTLRYYRSTNPTISTLDTEVASDAVEELPAAANSAELATLIAPEDAGTYYYGVCVDPVTGESDASNNCSASMAVQVQDSDRDPDLEVGPPSVSDTTLAAGTEFRLSATVRNTGDGASDATTLRYFRSPDSTISRFDREVGTDEVQTLAASGRSPELITLMAPSSAGTYYFGACVDTVTGESDTTDNCSASVEVEVEAAQQQPNLEAGSLSVSNGSPSTGSDFTLSATVRNTGDGASAATTLRYYRSVNATIARSDTQVGTDAVGALSASGSSVESFVVVAPQDAGIYYYGACVDAVTGETDTTDNCSTSVAVEVGEPTLYPDLLVGAPSVNDSTPLVGGEFTLSATVRNAGDGASAATLRYYRSVNATIARSDTQVGTDAVRALPASGSSVESFVVVAPQNAGTYYYGACVDAVTGETDTTDNCSTSVAVEVGEPTLYPDLLVGAPSVNDSTPLVGGEFTLSATVRNAGDGASAATTLRYYRSTDATIARSDTQVGTDAVGALSASGSSVESFVVVAPQNAGTYYYGACVDAVTGETDTTDNCSTSVAVEVGEPTLYPDLLVGAPSVNDSTPLVGGEFTLSATVRNAGDGASAATTLRYYRSVNATIARSDTQVGTDAVRALPASGSSVESFVVVAPQNAGTYYYGACVDAVTGETDTTDNCSTSVAVEVGEPTLYPDLLVGAPSVNDSTPLVGGEFTLSATVRNAGDGASAATTLRYYRSVNATIARSDTQVGTDAVRALPASGSSVESFVVVAPQNAGTYYYGACVDAVSGESSTNNNCSVAVPVTQSEPQGYPDLVVESPSVSGSNRTPGANFTVTVMVLNIGDGPSSSTTLSYYRSTDATITTSDTFVGASAVRALAVAGISRQPNSLAAPASPGTYYYGACVEPVSGESATNNNCSAAVPVTVSESQGGGQPETKVLLYTPQSVEERDGNEQRALGVVAVTTGDHPPTVSIPVRVWLVAGTAEEGVDFRSFSQSVEFNAEDFTLTGSRYEALEILKITILDDTEPEGDETFGATMTLESARPFVTLTPNYPDQLRVIIRANDDAG